MIEQLSKKLSSITPDVKFDIYRIDKINLFGQIIILKLFQMQKWV